MDTQQKKKIPIPVFQSAWQLIACLSAIGCALLSHYQQTTQASPYFIVQETIPMFIVVSITLAIISFSIPKQFMFIASVPIMYILVFRIINLFRFYGQWQEVILEALLFAGAAVVVLCATAYVFDSKKTPFVLLVLLFGTKLGALAYGIITNFIHSEYNFDVFKEVSAIEFGAYFLLFTSILTTTYVIANGKNKGMPLKNIAIPVQLQHSVETKEETMMADILPYVDGEVIQSMANNIQSGGDSNSADYGDIRRGLLSWTL